MTMTRHCRSLVAHLTLIFTLSFHSILPRHLAEALCAETFAVSSVSFIQSNCLKDLAGEPKLWGWYNGPITVIDGWANMDVSLRRGSDIAPLPCDVDVATNVGSGTVSISGSSATYTMNAGDGFYIESYMISLTTTPLPRQADLETGELVYVWMPEAFKFQESGLSTTQVSFTDSSANAGGQEIFYFIGALNVCDGGATTTLPPIPPLPTLPPEVLPARCWASFPRMSSSPSLLVLSTCMSLGVSEEIGPGVIDGWINEIHLNLDGTEKRMSMTSFGLTPNSSCDGLKPDELMSTSGEAVIDDTDLTFTINTLNEYYISEYRIWYGGPSVDEVSSPNSDILNFGLKYFPITRDIYGPGPLKVNSMTIKQSHNIGDTEDKLYVVILLVVCEDVVATPSPSDTPSVLPTVSPTVSPTGEVTTAPLVCYSAFGKEPITAVCLDKLNETNNEVTKKGGWFNGPFRVPTSSAKTMTIYRAYDGYCPTEEESVNDIIGVADIAIDDGTVYINMATTEADIAITEYHVWYGLTELPVTADGAFSFNVENFMLVASNLEGDESKAISIQKAHTHNRDDLLFVVMHLIICDAPAPI